MAAAIQRWPDGVCPTTVIIGTRVWSSTLSFQFPSPDKIRPQIREPEIREPEARRPEDIATDKAPRLREHFRSRTHRRSTGSLVRSQRSVLYKITFVEFYDPIMLDARQIASLAVVTMGLHDDISALRSRAQAQLPFLNTKEKSQHALVLPFFGTLGYRPLDVREVEPGFTVAMAEGGERRFDYAVKKDGAPVMLFRCEAVGTSLDAYDPASLRQCLEHSEARIGALTDGVDYRFYADLERFYAVLKGEASPDERPFLTFNVLDHSSEAVEDLKTLSKPAFDADQILSTAHHLKYKRLFRDYLMRQRDTPDAALVQFLARQVHDGKAPKGDAGMYESSVREALRQIISHGSTQAAGTAAGTGGASGKTTDEDKAGAPASAEPSQGSDAEDIASEDAAQGAASDSDSEDEAERSPPPT